MTEEQKIPTISISKTHHKLLSRLQRGAKKLKIFPKAEKIYTPIWERRGQTFEQYQKRTSVTNYEGTNTATPEQQAQFFRDAKKKLPNPQSITQIKIQMRIDGARVKESTRKVIRRMRGL